MGQSSITWAGHVWQAQELPAAAAGYVAQLADPHDSVRLTATSNVLTLAGIDMLDVTAVLGARQDDDVLEFLADVVCVGTARPFRSIVGLCRTTVRQWATIRGRLIDKGLADPLGQIQSLAALLDVVEVMLLDSMESDKDRDAFIKQLYRDTGVGDGAPAGWEDGADLDSLF